MVEVGGRGRVEVGKGGNGYICNNVNNKKEVKKKKKPSLGFKIGKRLHTRFGEGGSGDACEPGLMGGTLTDKSHNITS